MLAGRPLRDPSFRRGGDALLRAELDVGPDRAGFREVHGGVGAGRVRLVAPPDPHDLVAPGLERRPQNLANLAAMSEQEDAHARL